MNPKRSVSISFAIRDSHTLHSIVSQLSPEQSINPKNANQYVNVLIITLGKADNQSLVKILVNKKKRMICELLD